MFVIDDKGEAKRVRNVSDIEKINKERLNVFDENGKMLARKISKSLLISKMFGGR
ncbi:hypothetical protein [Methanolobus sp. ZRKC5]|uniref:hypothetical protein n=1 Tax=unclassified Methanolobus TaxID=2629569 RepID=UPI00313E75D2